MNNQFRNGFFYTAIGQYGNMGITLIINSILSRILTPNDYGIVAVLSVFIVFFQMLADLGVGPAIIQNKEIDYEDGQALFNYSIVLSLILAFSFLIVGNFLSIVYDDSIYTGLSQALSLAIFFFSAIVVPKSVLKKNKNFRIINICLLISSVVGGIVGIISAILDFGVYALVYSNIANAGTNFFLILYSSKLKPKISNFDTRPLKKIFVFAKNQTVFNFFNYFSRNMDSFLIGKFISPTDLGNYNKSYQLVMYPAAVFNGIINPVLQPVLSDYENSIDIIKSFYFKLVELLLVIGLPLSIFMSFNGKEIIYIMFGSQWVNSVIPFRILSLTIWIQILTVSTSAIFQSRNKTKELLYSGILTSSIIVSSIIIGVFFKTIIHVSISLSLGFALGFYISFSILLKRVLDSGWEEFLKIFYKPVIIAIICTFELFALRILLDKLDLNIFVYFTVNTGFFMLTYFILLWLTGELMRIKLLFEK